MYTLCSLALLRSYKPDCKRQLRGKPAVFPEVRPKGLGPVRLRIHASVADPEGKQMRRAGA